MHISLGRVLEAARERRVTLTPEVAGYVILLAARQLAVERSQISAQGVLLDEAGEVRVERAATATALESETVLRALLGDLVGLGSSPPPAIAAVAEREASGDLSGLVAELAAALIPINHSAAHRALARLYREVRRSDGQVMAMALPAIEERRAEPDHARAPAQGVARAATLEPPAELDIDVVVEPEVMPVALEPRGSASASSSTDAPPRPSCDDPRPPEALPRDLLAPELPTPPPGLHRDHDEPLDSRVAGASLEVLDEQRLELPPARPRWREARSDLQQLLGEFLVETRSIEHMLASLREMIGLQVRPARDAAVEGPSAAVPR